MNRVNCTVAAVIGGLLAASAPAGADVILSFGFTDLDGDWDGGSSTFTAVSTDQDGLRSGGDVSRQVAPIGTAIFETGFASGGTSASYGMSMFLSNITATTADVLAGDASFSVFDADGDSITGDITGQWTAGFGGFLFFNGYLDNVLLTDNGDQDGTFDGSLSGDFDLDFSPADPPFNGAIITLSINSSGQFFNSRIFSDASTLVSAQIVPGPASLALLGLGGLAAGGRRRRPC